MQRSRIVDALLGSYLAMVLIPAAVLSGLVTVATASLGTIIAAVIVVAAAFALAAAAVPDIANRTASLPVAAATVLPPLAYLAYLVVEPAGATEWLAIVGLLAVLPGIFVPIAGAVIRNQRLRADATEHVAVTVGDDEDDGLNRTAAGAVMAGMGLLVATAGVAVLAGFDLDGGVSMIGSLSAVSGSLVALFADDSTELAVTDAGLRVERHVTLWDDLAGFRVTADEIEIDRARWWLPTREFDREEIDDDAALIEALDEFLPRTDAASEAATAAAE